MPYLFWPAEQIQAFRLVEKRFAKHILLGLAIFICQSVVAQPQLATNADTLYFRAEGLISAGDYEGAEIGFLEAAKTYEKQGNHEKLAECYNYVGTTKFALRQFDQGIGWFEKALAEGKMAFAPKSQDLASLYMNIGSVWAQLQNPVKATGYLDTAMVIMEGIPDIQPLVLIALHNNLGEIFRQKGDLQGQRDQLLKSLSLIIANGLENSVAGMNVYNNLALGHFEMGRKAKAIVYGEKAVRIARAIYPAGRIELVGPLQNYGFIHARDQDVTLSVQYQMEAIQILEQQFGPISPRVAVAYRNLANTLNRDPFKALPYFDKSISIFEQLGLQNSLDAAVAYLDYGMTTRAIHTKGWINPAKASFLKVTQMELPDSPFANGVKAKAYGNLATLISGDRTAVDSAFDLVNTAMALVCKGFKAKGPYDNPELASFPTEFNAMMLVNIKSILIERKIEALEAKGDAASHKEANRLRIIAIQNDILALQVWDRLDWQTKEIEQPKSLPESITEIYDHIIRLSHELYLEDYDPKYVNLAFFAAEYFAATSYLQEIEGLQAEAFANVPPMLLKLDHQVRSDIAYCKRKALEMDLAGQTLASQSWKDQLVIHEQKLDQLQQYLQQNYPKYFEIKAKPAPVPIATIQREALDKETIVVEYHENAVSIAVVAFTKREAQFLMLKKDSTLFQQLNTLRKSLADPDFIQDMDGAYQRFSGSSAFLYARLIAPLEANMDFDGLKRMVIIPDGILQLLPFEVLLREAAPAEFADYSSLHYLMKDFSISYAHSAMLQHKQGRKEARSKALACLAFSPESSEKDSENAQGELPGAAAEIEALRKHFNTVSLQGKEANEQHFKEWAGSYKWLHLAMHGHADKDQPMNSYLQFVTPTDSSAADDGKLFPYEIYNLPLDADLAVLGACETGLGEVIPGEGINSLSRAFEFAGCRNVVPSLWKIDDKSTSLIMGEFYQQLAKGRAKDHALRNAKLRYLEQAKGLEGHPYYWAGNILIANEPLSQEGGFNWGLFLLILLALGLPVTLTWMGWNRAA